MITKQMRYTNSMNRTQRIVAGLAVVGVFCVPLFAFAQLGGGGTVPGGSSVVVIQNPLQCTALPDCVDLILTFLLQISVPIVTIMVIIGGFFILTGGGSPEQLRKGKNTILYAVIGFAAILLAKGVTTVIINILTPSN